MLNPWLGLAILIGAQLALIVALRAIKHRFGAHPEVTRKVSHVALGVSLLACPFLFDVAWPLYALTGAAVFVIAVMRWLPVINERFGGVVGGVARGSAGDFYFPLAAAGLYWLTGGHRILFGIPILILTFADAIAALIGVFYGRLRMTGADKTLEGSVSFFLVAFAATYVPLVSWTLTSRGAALIIAIIIGLLVTVLEAASRHGSDNFFIPFGGYLLLKSFEGVTTARLGVMLAVVLTVLALVLTLRRVRSLNDPAMLAAVLVGFVVWSVGGWQWIVPPLVFFLTYTPLWPRKSLLRHRPHDVTSITAVVSAGLLWLLFSVRFRLIGAYYLFTLSYAAHLTFVGITWHRFAKPKANPVLAIIRSALTAWAVMFAPFLVIAGRHATTEQAWSGVAVAWLVLGGAAFMAMVRWGRLESEPTYPWARQAILGVATSALGLVAVSSIGGH